MFILQQRFSAKLFLLADAGDSYQLSVSSYKVSIPCLLVSLSPPLPLSPSPWAILAEVKIILLIQIFVFA